MCIFLKNKHMKAKIVFGSCVLQLFNCGVF